jgi:phenylacetate-CoA ligase
MQTPRSSIPEFVWPGIPSGAGATLMGLQFQLEQSQWWPPETVATLQSRQLQCLLQHAYRTVPYYKDVLDAASIDTSQPLSPEQWLQIPLLTRQSLQERADDLLSRAVPSGHGKTFQKKTSGSTGKQIKVTDTDANRLFWQASTLRDHLWHKRDFSGRLVAIRSGRYAQDPLLVKDHESWGPSTNQVFRTGPSTVFFQRMPVDQQAEQLQSLDPAYALMYPSNAVSLANYFLAHDLRLSNLQQVITYGETLPPETRKVCRDAWGVSVSDMYSCEEVGYIALQCPQTDHYHCQAESVLVEVLNDDGRPCAPGQIGKVVLTALHNFAMPLIRYQNLDYAEVGSPCPCGRGLPVIKRVLGRERNMAKGIDGTQFWPQLSPDVWREVDGIVELQLVQDDIDHIELRAVCQQPLDDTQERKLTNSLTEALGQPFRFSIRYHDKTLRHDNGKYERFICKV